MTKIGAKISVSNFKETGAYAPYGPELVINGTFDTDTDWTKGTGWTISAGTANCDGTQIATSNLSSNQFFCQTGDVLLLEFDVLNYTAGTLDVTILNTGELEFQNITANGSYSIETDPIDIDANSLVRFIADVSFVGSLDNVSVRKKII